MVIIPEEISLELIPRSLDSLYQDALLAASFKRITHINIPDLERFPISSLDAVDFLRKHFGSRFIYVPHIVAKNNEDVIEAHRGPCLLVNGDEHAGQRIYSYGVMHSIVLVHGRCYVAFDQYRGDRIREFAYLLQKIDQGATGAFTQPFFSLEELDEWDADIPDTYGGVRCFDVFYGVCPVVSEKSKTYWEEKNGVIFPDSFKLSLDYNIAFARKVIVWAKARQRGVYLMPIRVPLKEYLEGVFRP